MALLRCRFLHVDIRWGDSGQNDEGIRGEEGPPAPVIAHLKVNKIEQQPVSSRHIPFWAVKSLWV